MDSLFETIRVEAERFLKEDPGNVMGGSPGDEPIWATPLLGAARGDDPIFEVFRDKVDERHWMPVDAFAAGGYAATPSELSVVSWILPHTDVTKKDNARQKDQPSERWARSRIFGEQENDSLRRHMVDFLKKAGIDADALSRGEFPFER